MSGYYIHIFTCNGIDNAKSNMIQFEWLYIFYIGE